MGRIRSLDRKIKASRNEKAKASRRGQIIKSTKDGRGYLKVRLSKNGERKNYKVHRLVAQAFVDGEKESLVVDHINRNRFDNRAENLRWVTPIGNMHNTIRKTNTGEKHISYREEQEKKYRVEIRRKSTWIYKCFYTLEEAIRYRDSLELEIVK